MSTRGAVLAAARPCCCSLRSSARQRSCLALGLLAGRTPPPRDHAEPQTWTPGQSECDAQPFQCRPATPAGPPPPPRPGGATESRHRRS
eukprot:3786848-Prymnesium_polylepis.1